jgi:hypothetical protein
MSMNPPTDRKFPSLNFIECMCATPLNIRNRPKYGRADMVDMVCATSLTLLCMSAALSMTEYGNAEVTIALCPRRSFSPISPQLPCRLPLSCGRKSLQFAICLKTKKYKIFENMLQ